MRFQEFGVYCGLAAPVVFIITFAVSVSVFQGYNPSENYLSDIGANEASGAVFNPGVILTGILAAIFGLSMFGTFKGYAKFGALLFTLAGLSMLGLGAFHQKYDSEYALLGIYRTVYEPSHVIAAGLFFLSGALALILLGVCMRKTAKWNIVTLTGILPLAFLALQYPIVEHVAVFSIIIGVLIMAFLVRKNN